MNNNINCYNICPYYHYYDNKNIYHCTYNLSCPDNYPTLLQDENECIKKNEINTNKINNENTINTENSLSDSSKPEITENTKSNNYNYNTEIPLKIENKTQNYITNIYTLEEIQKKINAEINTTSKLSKEEQILYYNEILSNIESVITSNNFDTFLLDNGEDKLITMDKMFITLTTTDNINTNLNNNITLVHLAECEKALRNFYNISEKENLYLKKIDILQQGMKIPKIEYDVYSKLFGQNLTKLNLSICNETKISITIPIKISENLDILNTSSGYYNDFCYITKDSGIDLLIKDRQKEFIKGNKTICQEDCDFSYYNYSSNTANCSCFVKASSNNFENMNINMSKLYDNFEEVKNGMDISNLGITSCNVLTSSDNIKSNSGFYLLLIIIICFIIVFIIFYCKGYDLLKNKIDEVIYERFKEEKKHKKNKIKNKLTVEDNKEEKIPSKKIKNSKRKKGGKTLPLNKKNSKNELINKNLNININKDQEISLIQKYKPDTDYEFNWLSYEEALKFDKRENCDYYSSLLQNKQLFIFTFCSFNDYNSGVIKKFMFFLSFALHYTVNALFFTENNFHQIYIDDGQFNFGYQFPYILISAIIANLIMRLMLHFLVLTDKDVLMVKLQEKKELAIDMKQKVLKYIVIKFSIFFVLNFILLVLFWYYLTCFNAVYSNTQIYLIENTFISFGLSLFYPFVVNIIPMILRNSALHSDDKKRSCLYKASQIIQVI